MIRFFDILFSIAGLILLSPLLILIALWIAMDSPGGPFYLQWRIGKKGKAFRIFKFRTMYKHADELQSLTIGKRDHRITHAGIFLRQYKLDELPQLLNIITGDMSLVGPRPEVKKYVSLYNAYQLKNLDIKPGITDIASLIFADENQLLDNMPDPEFFYINKIMPLKIRLNQVYRSNHSLQNYFKILVWSVFHVLHIPNTRIQRLEKECRKRISVIPEVPVGEPQFKTISPY